jgi:hydrogenase maturation protease
LIAGMGNALRSDDGFGVAVASTLLERPPSPGVKVVEVGIGGIHLVHELLDGYDALVIVDSVDRASPPGSVFILEPSVPRLECLSTDERQGLLADTHYAVPSRVLVMARALGILPPVVRIVGCQPADPDALGTEMSEAVRGAVPRAVEEITRLVSELM